MTYADIITYFSTLAEQHIDIQDLVVADYEDIVSRQRQSIKYPCMWIEAPSATLQGDTDSTTLTWSGACVILINGARTPTDQASNLDKAFRIARSIVLRLQYDMEQGILSGFRIANRRLEAINPIYDDNDQGWRFTFDIEVPVGAPCHDPDEWAPSDIPEPQDD